MWLMRELLLIFHFLGTFGFNIDVDQAILKSSVAGTLFGFSVSPHYLQKENQSRIIVGAPLESGTFSKDPSKNPSGSLFQCPLSSASKDCAKIPIGSVDTDFVSYNHSRGFLGMNVISATSYGGSRVFGCEPRARTKTVGGKAYTPGVCYGFENDLKTHFTIGKFTCFYTGISRGNAASFHFCLVGMSAATNGKDQSLFGSPFITVSKNSSCSGGSQLYTEKYKEQNDKPGKFIFTRDTPSAAYLGWSVAMGRVFSDSELTVVSGGPGIPMKPMIVDGFLDQKSSQIGMGMVLLYKVTKKDGVNKHTAAQALYGTQFGSRFGQTLLVADINNDSFDDLLVGAPYYRSDEESIGSGAVYLYMNDKGNRMIFKRMLQPSSMSIEECKKKHCERSKFGFALSNLKDVNLDGYNDIGISAPGEGDGVIYIYHGMADGLDPTPVQKLTLPKTKQFGYSLGQGMDLDNNGYPDLVAGAMGSDSAAVMRARPILRVNADIEFQYRILEPDLKKVSKNPCAGGTSYCFKMTVKYSYQPASPRDKFSDTLTGNITLEADTEPKITDAKPRIKFLKDDKTKTKILVKKVDFTRKQNELVIDLALEKNHFMDKLNPIKFKVSWTLDIQSPSPLKAGSPLPPINNFPVYDTVSNYKNASIEWKNPCKGRCTSDLKLRLATSLKKEENEDSIANYTYFMGKDNSVWMNFTTENRGEYAYSLELVLKKNDMITLDSAICQFGCRTVDDKIMCRMSNPLGINRMVVCNILLSTSNLRPDMRYLNFSASVSTLSKNLNNYPTTLKFKASVKIQANIQLTRMMDHYQITYSNTTVLGASAITHEKRIGDQRITASFKLENRMRSLVPSSTLTILWPFEIAGNPSEPHGKYLLYMLTAPEIESKSNNTLECDKNALKTLVNPNHVRLLGKGGEKNSTKYLRTARYRRSIDLSPTYVTKKKNYEICSNGLARCRPIVCTVRELGKQSGPITISFSFRVWIHTLVEDFSNAQNVKIVIAASWKSDPRYSVSQIAGSNTKTNATLLASSVMDLKPQPPKEFTLIIILSALGGVILFGCLVIILWKCNFFKRTNLQKKHQEMIRQSRMQ